MELESLGTRLGLKSGSSKDRILMSSKGVVSGGSIMYSFLIFAGGDVDLTDSL